MKRTLVVLLAVFANVAIATADEGMWLINRLSKENIAQMKKRGMKLSAKDIYDLNKSCLEDAIVIFGGGCTGEIVSNEGLLLTNHHCGYPNIQQHSTVEHDYLKDGFWAMTREQEIPTPGLEVRFIREIRDVTSEILKGVDPKMDEKTRAELIKQNTQAAFNAAQSVSPFEITVKDIFGGNQYIMIFAEVFKDVRLVGTPPTSIGKFGGDTDNWMWPRHTGDFSMFRVYSAPDNSPAEYAKENKPYNPKSFLKVSLGGYKAGDYAMIIGFPGRTNRYMSSYEIDKTLSLDNPNRIYIRGERQKLLMEDMKASDKVRIQYASKYAQSSNYWKNSIGMSRGLVKLNVKGDKEDIETRLTEWIKQSPERVAKYGDALKLKAEGVKGIMPYENVLQIYNEGLMQACEIFGMSMSGKELGVAIKKMTDEGKYTSEIKSRLKNSAIELFKDYNESTDKKVTKRMLEVVKEKLPAKDLPSFYAEVIDAKFGGDIAKFVDNLYDNSYFASAEKLTNFIDNPDFKRFENDPASATLNSIHKKYREYIPGYQKYFEMVKRGHREFIAAYMEMNKGKEPYPDANQTMRVTYGQVLPYSPADGITYNYYTTLAGIIAKEDTSNPMEFTVDPKLKELYAKKDYGRYGVNGELPVAFLSNNDITGGNSGSPIMNKRGELIGLAFDGNWEAMSGDIAFEPALQRTINVDIRYVLFVIDKFAGATHLVNEMTLVK